MKRCRLVIKDEVNVKFEGLDLEARKKLTKEFKYFVPYARHMPSYKLGRWDGCISFFNLGGSTYLNFLPDILPHLDDWDIDIEDLRQIHEPFSFQTVTPDTYSDTVWPAGHPKEGEPVVLRDYQIEIINKFLENPQALQEIATGAGKCRTYDSTLTINIADDTAFATFLLNKHKR